jgi:predicted heme/steroid binding protein
MDKEYTYEEFEKHNTIEDGWISIDKKIYNVTDWIHEHPGGVEFLSMSLGMECTNLFDSYHKTSTSNYLGTKVPQIGVLVNTKFPMYEKKTDFYPVLKKRVETYFKEKKLESRSLSTFNILNTIFIYSVYIGCIYNALFVKGLSMMTRSILCFIVGVFHHLLAVHVLHDCSHGSYSSNP